MPRALLSVSDKRGLLPFARALHDLGWTLLSTGGTARVLREAELPAVDVAEITGHGEMMDGRVKTLHPAVHAGILARQGNADDDREMVGAGYEPIDLVAVNLYPFRETVAAGAERAEALENIDIGGPTLLRAAAKNHARVWPVCDPADYERVVAALEGDDDPEAGRLRAELAAAAFAHTASYDTAIAGYLSGRDAPVGEGERTEEMPERLSFSGTRAVSLRYGENPDQPAAVYTFERSASEEAVPGIRQHHGKPLSFNNLVDLEAGRAAVAAWDASRTAACAVIKHDTPCGIAVGSDAAEAVRKAQATDPMSAFGSVIVLNHPVSLEVATLLRPAFVEVIAAPAFHERALALLKEKKNLRLLSWIEPPRGPEWNVRLIQGGMLVQRPPKGTIDEAGWRTVTRRPPSDEERREMSFAWRAVAAVKSNAILLARGGMAIGIGAGQMSRVDASRLAVRKAREQEHDPAGSVLASDAFFPFRDGVEAAAAEGVRAVIQPGGSVRDDEVIAAADEHGIAMIFTGRRCFRH